MVKVSVFKFLGDGTKKELYRNTVDNIDGIKFEYDQIYYVLRLLYPASDGVEFCVMN